MKFARPLMDLSLDDLRDYLVCLKEVASSEEKRRTRTESGETSTSQPLLLATDKVIPPMIYVKSSDMQVAFVLTNRSRSLAPVKPDDSATVGLSQLNFDALKAPLLSSVIQAENVSCA